MGSTGSRYANVRIILFPRCDMNSQDMHTKALREWRNSSNLRRRFPTFEFYWHENYERVYLHMHKAINLKSILKLMH